MGSLKLNPLKIKRKLIIIKKISPYSVRELEIIGQRYVKSSTGEPLLRGRGKYVPSLNINYGRLAFWGGRPFPCPYFNPFLSRSVAISFSRKFKFKFKFIYSHSFNYNTTIIRKKEVNTELSLNWIQHKKVKMCLACKRAKLSSWLLQLSLGFVYIFFLSQ